MMMSFGALAVVAVARVLVGNAISVGESFGDLFGTDTFGHWSGLFTCGGFAPLGAQGLAALPTTVYVAIAPAVIALAVKYTIGLRGSEEVEDPNAGPCRCTCAHGLREM